MIQTKIQREYIAARSAEEKMGYPCLENLGVAPPKKGHGGCAPKSHFFVVSSLFFVVSSVREQCQKVVCSLISASLVAV